MVLTESASRPTAKFGIGTDCPKRKTSTVADTNSRIDITNTANNNAACTATLRYNFDDGVGGQLKFTSTSKWCSY